MKSSQAFLDKYGIVKLDSVNRFGDPLYKLTKDVEVFGVIVPAGYVTDLASIPKWVQPIVQAKDQFNFVALAHDLYYTTHEVKRKPADAFLRDHLETFTFLERLQKWTVYLAIQALGRTSWKSFPSGPFASNVKFIPDDKLNATRTAYSG